MVKRDEESSLDSFKDDFFVQLLIYRQDQGSNWLKVLREVYQANQKLLNYQMVITVKRNEPRYCNITFNHSDLSDFDVLKNYVGEYGFVVPVK